MHLYEAVSVTTALWIRSIWSRSSICTRSSSGDISCNPGSVEAKLVLKSILQANEPKRLYSAVPSTFTSSTVFSQVLPIKVVFLQTSQSKYGPSWVPRFSYILFTNVGPHWLVSALGSKNLRTFSLLRFKDFESTKHRTVLRRNHLCTAKQRKRPVSVHLRLFYVFFVVCKRSKRNITLNSPWLSFANT